ncbi:MAG: glycoside hydrolase family 97 protein [Phycisphaerales bacterium]|nr:MAG: glycoside hydrolase family 97 protein [Phycisphaerales bacterium]
MNIRRAAAITALFVGLLVGVVDAQQGAWMASPDGKIRVTLYVAEKGGAHPHGHRLYYSVTYGKHAILRDCPVGFDVEGVSGLSDDVMIFRTQRRVYNDVWHRLWGKSEIVHHNCNELRVTLQCRTDPERTVDVIWRVYNDGLAFRLFLPRQHDVKKFKLTGESSWFRFTDNHAVWVADYGQFTTHQESEFAERRLSDLRPGGIYGLPLLVRAGNAAWVAITEASLTDWAGMYVTGVAGVPNTVRTLLSPHPDDPGVCVTSRTPRYSPWRVLMIGSNPGDLIESDLIANLNEPCKLKDTSWIEPGRCAWDGWWPGRYAPDAEFPLGANDETMKYFIDFAAEMGWEYQLVDWQWYGPPFAEEIGGPAHPTSDITTPIPGIDIPTLVEYAESKGVRLLVWLHWAHADKQMDRAFPLYERWGVAGVKIDFMTRDDQEMVDFYERVVKKAAKHHLVVDFHGAYKPTGLSRTYPNLLTREGVLGNEYNKWSDRVTPDHCLTLPFTRMLAGPMDFTPGGFRHGTRETFKVVGGDAPAPMVFGTRAFQLAMLVVYESPLQVLCDTPYEYRQSPAGLDFLRIVPTTWDQTEVLNAQVGDFITVARRSGFDWYVGSMNDWTARELTIPLQFLGNNKYEATIWIDGDDTDEKPASLTRTTHAVTKTDQIQATLAPGGGQVIHLRPIR